VKVDTSRIYVVTSDDLDDERDRIKCPSCGWRVSRVFVLADSKEEAIKIVKNGEGGICAECFLDMLMEM